MAAKVLINALQLVQQRVLKRATERAATWSEPSELRSRSGLLPVIRRIEVRIDRVDIHTLPSRLAVVQCARHSAGLRARTERPCPCRPRHALNLRAHCPDRSRRRGFWQ